MKIQDQFTSYMLAKEIELFGDDASPELTHAFRLGAVTAMTYACDLLYAHEARLRGPAS